jgi:MYXO-CTERM domain-containing protein
MRNALLSALASAALIASLSGSAAGQTIRRIAIDPGHGGSDPGGVGNGLQEKNIVLDVGRRFRDLLNADTNDTGGGGRWVALMTRSTDVFVSLSARASFANNQDADRFMSIHSNAFGSASANGTETFSFREGTTGAALRNLVQQEMIAAWGLTNRGNKTANFAVLRETAMPAVLHELAFITNTGDAAKLASATERQKAAVAHLRAIQRHFGITPHIPGTVDSTSTGELAGTIVDDRGPVAGATVALDTGPEVVTPDDGTFTFTKVAAGTRTLTISARGYEDQTVEVDVAAGALSEQEIALTPSAVTGDDGGSESESEGEDEGDGPAEPDPGDSAGSDAEPESGGCATGASSPGSARALLLFGLAALIGLRRRRAR